jgi:hypothetical protein
VNGVCALLCCLAAIPGVAQELDGWRTAIGAKDGDRWKETAFDDAHWERSAPRCTAAPEIVRYRLRFQVPRLDSDHRAGLRLRDLPTDAKVWLNEEPLSKNDADITPGSANVIAVEFHGPGTFGGVELIVTRRVYATALRIAAQPDLATGTAVVHAAAMVRNTLDNMTNIEARFDVLLNGQTVGKGSASGAIPPFLTQPLEASIPLEKKDIRLWDPDHPVLYELRAVISKAAEAVEGAYDTEITGKFGIRHVETDGPDLRLNGEAIRLPRRALGTCVSKSELESLKEAGFTFNEANTATESLYEWADAHGMLIRSGERSGHVSAIDVPRDFLKLYPAEARPTREELSPVYISGVSQVNGVTQIEVRRRATFPMQAVRGYELRVGNQSQTVPELRAGESVKLDFFSVNPYLVQLRTPQGIVVSER